MPYVPFVTPSRGPLYKTARLTPNTLLLSAYPLHNGFVSVVYNRHQNNGVDRIEAVFNCYSEASCSRESFVGAFFESALYQLCL